MMKETSIKLLTEHIQQQTRFGFILSGMNFESMQILCFVKLSKFYFYDINVKSKS